MAIGPSSGRDGYQKARQVRPGCVTGSLRLPRDVSGLEGESAMVKFQVDETGSVSQFTYLSGPTDQRIAIAIWSAVQRCEWAPGVSATGTPLTLWVTMPIKFGR
jgi:TonB family protein